MTVKRQNHGRQKVNRGSVCKVQCIQCGRVTPKDKSISKTINTSVIDHAAMDDLKAHSIYKEVDVPKFFKIDDYCISCACHLRVVKVRGDIHRKERHSSKYKVEEIKY